MLQILGSLRYAGSLYVTGINPVKRQLSSSQNMITKTDKPKSFFQILLPIICALLIAFVISLCFFPQRPIKKCFLSHKKYQYSKCITII